MKILRLFAVIAILVVALAGCGKNDSNLSEAQKKVCGSWAYVHDKETEVLKLKDDGTAKYEKNKYTYEVNDTYITLMNTKGETVKFRYEMDGEDMLLYFETEYEYSGETEPNGIIGVWSNEKKWSFEFTTDGTFMEDGYFPGYYFQDEATKSVKLVYNDHFEDTTIYYTVDGNKLTLQYPWKMVTTE